MEEMKNQYEKAKIEISCFNDQDVVATSQIWGEGDGWVQDPFTQD